jgi:hypothetical protein
MPGALCYLAVTESGELAGGAAAAVYSGLATLFADSTIALYRRCGLHRELIAASHASGLKRLLIALAQLWRRRTSNQPRKAITRPKTATTTSSGSPKFITYNTALLSDFIFL